MGVNEDKTQIDWEVRRYEIAKEVYLHRLLLDNGSYSSTALLYLAETSVKAADVLISELKPGSS